MTIERFTRTARTVAVITLLLPLGAACGGGDTADHASASPTSTAARSSALSEEDPGSPSPDASAGTSAFDPAAVPLSEAPLGDFPYLTIPEGFENPNAPIPVVPHGRVPFWTGDRLEWVEGRVHQSPVYARNGREFSGPELTAAVGSAVTALGGVRVTDSPMPGEIRDSIPREVRVDYAEGFGDMYNNPVSTYVIRRADRLIWIHLCADSAGASWLIAESTT
ncbi:hypothetical protein OG393_03695 [Streptomyces sp. NBC_01216]|uniref:hypothetical protein n=1 Tax=Streptomyces sp. NBC_01216 TaxID=2903778 RepID=UPI002E142786|nr:hypothetical protein OG393_03695 [Streptomyces sp. NBC_01216]